MGRSRWFGEREANGYIQKAMNFPVVSSKPMADLTKTGRETLEEDMKVVSSYSVRKMDIK